MHHATIGLCESTAVAVAVAVGCGGGGAGSCSFHSSSLAQVTQFWFGDEEGKVGCEYPYIQPRVLRHHSLYAYSDALNHSQQDRTADG